MTIYIVTDGVYSDRHIIGCTVDKNKAEQVAELFRNGSVIEWELEKFIHLCDDGRSIYYYVHNGGDPFIELVKQSYDHGYLYSECECRGLNTIFGLDDDECFVKAFSKEQARKIGEDLYAEWKAEKEGVGL